MTAVLTKREEGERDTERRRNGKNGVDTAL